MSSCSERLCDGLYGVGGCPCAVVTHYPRQVLSVELVVVTVTEEMGLRIPPFNSHRLTEAVVGQETLQVFIFVLFVVHLIIALLLLGFSVT